jgi:hypothetical protein
MDYRIDVRQDILQYNDNKKTVLGRIWSMAREQEVAPAAQQTSCDTPLVTFCKEKMTPFLFRSPDIIQSAVTEQKRGLIWKETKQISAENLEARKYLFFKNSFGPTDNRLNTMP